MRILALIPLTWVAVSWRRRRSYWQWARRTEAIHANQPIPTLTFLRRPKGKRVESVAIR